MWKTCKIKKSVVLLIWTYLMLCLAGCGASGKKPEAAVDPEQVSVYRTTLSKEPITAYQSCFYGGHNEIVYASDEDLNQFLDSQPDCNTVTVFLPWSLIEKERGIYELDQYHRVFDLIINRGYSIIVVIDAEARPMVRNSELMEVNSIPNWIFDLYPEDRAVDFYGNPRLGLDFYSTDHIPVVLEFYETCLNWLDENYRDHILAITPGFQSENEVKFSQQGYCWESYTDHAVMRFRDYLQQKYGNVEEMNALHQAEYSSFDEIALPVIDYNGSVLGQNEREDFLYTDFMDFREQAIWDYAKNFADAIHGHQYQTIGYFGQFMYPSDGIYAAGAARKCADIYDYAVIDYNFYDGYDIRYDTLVSAFMTNLMRNLGYDKVFTGLYFERLVLEGHEDFVRELEQNILSDGHADGYEIGSIVEQNEDTVDQYRFANPQSKNSERAQIAVYTGEWSYYKTHGEEARLMNYLNDSAVYLYDILQNKLGMPVEVITDQNILQGDLDAFDLVFFPAQYYMSDAEIEEIQKYLDQGGKIIQDYQFGIYNEYGEERSNQKLFGVDKQDSLEEDTVLQALGQGWPEKLTVESLYEGIPACYTYSGQDAVTLYEKKGLLHSAGICQASGNTMTWGFQPQLQYAKSKDQAFIDFIYASVLYMENRMEKRTEKPGNQ